MHTFLLPKVIRCYNGVVIDSVEALCICLKRYAYPCRYADLIPRCSRPVPQLCMAANAITEMIYNRYSNLLTDVQFITVVLLLKIVGDLWMVQSNPFAVLELIKK